MPRPAGVARISTPLPRPRVVTIAAASKLLCLACVYPYLMVGKVVEAMVISHVTALRLKVVTIVAASELICLAFVYFYLTVGKAVEAMVISRVTAPRLPRQGVASTVVRKGRSLKTSETRVVHVNTFTAIPRSIALNLPREEPASIAARKGE